MPVKKTRRPSHRPPDSPQQRALSEKLRATRRAERDARALAKLAGRLERLVSRADLALLQLADALATRQGYKIIPRQSMEIEVNT